MRPTRWLRAPLLHFVLGGALLFRFVHGTGTGATASAPIVLTADDVARLRVDYTRDTGLEPTPDDERALIGKAVEEERLFREALARGLDRNDRSVHTWLVEQMMVLTDDHAADPDRLYEQALALGLDRSDLVVRRMLVQKMRLLAARIDEQPPDDDTLAAYYDAHRDEYVPPARVALWHVFLAASSHGDATAHDAAVLLASLRADGRAPRDAIRRGDAFPVPPHLVGQSPAQIEKLFGPAFVTRIAGAPPQTWIGPVPSSYGLHLVWIESREPGVAPAFAAVRERVRERWQDERRSERIAALMRELARRYPVRVDSPAWRERSAS